MEKIKAFFKSLFRIAKKPNPPALQNEDDSDGAQHRTLPICDGAIVRLSTYCGPEVGKVYHCAEVRNYSFPELGWRPVSPRFRDSKCGTFVGKDEANRHLFFNILKGTDERAAKRVALLESLQRNCEEQGIDWFFWYVAHVLTEFASFSVADESKVEISCVTQVDDMGDEYFDAVYSTKKELGLDTSTGYIQKYQHVDNMPELRNQIFNTEGKYKHIGSSARNMLEIHWTFNIDDIKLGTETKEEN